MPAPPLAPPVANEAPTSDVLTGYDQEHLISYLRLLDAEADQGDRTEVARIVLRPVRAVERQIGGEARDAGEVLLDAEAGRLEKRRGERRIAAGEMLREKRPAAPKRGADMRRDH